MFLCYDIIFYIYYGILSIIGLKRVLDIGLSQLINKTRFHVIITPSKKL